MSLSTFRDVANRLPGTSSDVSTVEYRRGIESFHLQPCANTLNGCAQPLSTTTTSRHGAESAGHTQPSDVSHHAIAELAWADLSLTYSPDYRSEQGGD